MRNDCADLFGGNSTAQALCYEAQNGGAYDPFYPGQTGNEFTPFNPSPVSEQPTTTAQTPVVVPIKTSTNGTETMDLPENVPVIITMQEQAFGDKAFVFIGEHPFLVLGSIAAIAWLLRK